MSSSRFIMNAKGWCLHVSLHDIFTPLDMYLHALLETFFFVSQIHLQLNRKDHIYSLFHKTLTLSIALSTLSFLASGLLAISSYPHDRLSSLSLSLFSSTMIRVIATTRNKQQQRFCEFIKPLLDRIFDLHLKVSDFEELKIIGRGAFGQVALVKVR